MSYQIKLIEGKPWVVEVKKEMPKEKSFVDSLNDFWIDEYNRAMANYLLTATKYPTLEADKSTWLSMQGKELWETDFQLVHKASDIGVNENITAIPIPQLNEDDVWKELAEVFRKSLAVSRYQLQSITAYLKQHYNISKK